MQHRTETLEGITVNIPAGSLDPPTEELTRIVEKLYNPTNWKLPTREFRTDNEHLARDVAYTLDWFLGGHEIRREGTEWVVTSKGYYHYIGA